MSARQRPAFGDRARAAMRVDAGGRKRRALLVLIAGYRDAGVLDPSIRELARDAQLPRRVASDLVDRLERDGLVAIERGDPRRQERNVYTLRCLQDQPREPA